MSRTFRRKNFEKTQATSWDRQGDKVAGAYTEYDLERLSWMKHYREPTERERYMKWRYFHGESSTANSYSPSRGFREYREAELRIHNSNEFRKWLTNPEYDPMFMASPKSHWWDWS